MHDEGFVTTVIAIVALLFLASISAVIARRIRFPYTIGLVVVGVLVAFLADGLPEVAHALEAFKLQPVMIMFLFIPVLIFESAYSMNARLLMKNIVPVMTLAGPGLLLSTAIIGTLIWGLTPLPFESALVFGCLISATDPVAVIALFKEVGAPKRLTILMEGESVFNDATAIVTFQIILAVIATGILDVQTITGGVIDFFAVFFGGLVVGLIIGWLVVQTIPLVGDQPLVHITLTLVAAYGAFIIADHYLAASGVMAVLAAGMTIGYYAPTRHRRRVHEYLEMFWEDAAFVANSLIFLMLGLSEKIFLGHAGSNPSGLLYPVLIAIAVVLVGRFAVIYATVPVLNRYAGGAPVSRPYQAILAWGGLRGAIAIALAISLPSHFPYRWQIIDFTFGVVLFTLVVNGTTMKWLMDRLGLTKPSPEEAYLAAYGRVEAERAARDRLSEDKGVAAAEVRDAYRAELDGRVQSAEQALAACRSDLGSDAATRRDLLWLGCFALQRKILRQREQEGLLQTGPRLELEDDLDVTPRRDAPVRLRLPSDRVSLAGALRGLSARMRPGGRRGEAVFKAWAEEASAVVAAAEAVLADLDEIAAATRAAADDVEACRVWHTALRDAAEALYRQSTEGHAATRDRIERRMLEGRAQDARADRLRALAAHGALPEPLADRLCEGFEKEATG